jgi:hypothetical protein
MGLKQMKRAFAVVWVLSAAAVGIVAGVAEGHALAGAAASEQAERLALGNLERNIVEYLPRSEGLGDVMEAHGAHPDTAG